MHPQASRTRPHYYCGVSLVYNELSVQNFRHSLPHVIPPLGCLHRLEVLASQTNRNCCIGSHFSGVLLFGDRTNSAICVSYLHATVAWSPGSIDGSSRSSNRRGIMGAVQKAEAKREVYISCINTPKFQHTFLHVLIKVFVCNCGNSMHQVSTGNEFCHRRTTQGCNQSYNFRTQTTTGQLYKYNPCFFFTKVSLFTVVRNLSST